MASVGRKNGETGRGRYYTPPAEIRLVAGLTKRVGTCWFDEYVGTGEVIVASGLLRDEQLPGREGLPASAVSYRPNGTDRSDCWASTPGYMTVHRLLDGRYRVKLTVDAAEQERRQAVLDAQRLARRAKHEQELAEERLHQDNNWGKWGRLSSADRQRAWADLRDLTGPAREMPASRVRELMSVLDAADAADLERSLDDRSFRIAASAVERIARMP